MRRGTKVLREFAPVGKYRVREIEPDEGAPVVLDVREYIKTETFEGFTRRGIRLDREEVRTLSAALLLFADGDGNVPCVECGRRDLPLHYNRRCGECGPGDEGSDRE